MKIEDTCCCGAKLVLHADNDEVNEQISVEKRHSEWLKAHAKCSLLKADADASKAFWK